MHFSTGRGELAAVLAEQAFQRNLSLLHLGWVVLTLLGKPDLFLFEAIKYIALRNRAQARVLDLTDRGFLSDVNVNDHALGGVLPFEAKVVVVARVPERVEVPLHRLGIVYVPCSGEDSRPYGLGRNAAVPMNQHILDERLLRKKAKG